MSQAKESARQAPMKNKKSNNTDGRMRRLKSASRLDADETHVNVAVRCRPMSKKEEADGYESIIEFEDDKKVVVHDPSATPSDQLGTMSGERRNFSRVYDFDAVFEPAASQADVYFKSCKTIVDSVLEGFNGTIFAYGQTGTGKTYTMEGSSKRSKQGKANNSDSTLRSSSGNDDSYDYNYGREESVGIMPRAFKHIFKHVDTHKDVQFLIRASYLEIYQEQIRDLLRKDRSVKLELHENNEGKVYVKDLTSIVCKSMADIERVTEIGKLNRSVAATEMNEHSSRSHAILIIAVEQQIELEEKLVSIVDGSKGNNDDDSGDDGSGGLKTTRKSSNSQRIKKIRVGKLNLVDLAGSERQRKTNSSGERQKESIKINLSLSALGNVINSLMRLHTSPSQSTAASTEQVTTTTRTREAATNYTNEQHFTPYRDSKLTRLLQDSLGGNAKTLMIANIGPASYNYDETINTLNYASRAKCIRNKPRLNEDAKGTLLRELQAEIDHLRAKLAARQSATGGGNIVAQQRTKPNSALSSISVGSGSDGSEKELQQSVEQELDSIKSKLRSLESKLLNSNVTGGDIVSEYVDRSLLQGYTEEQQNELKRRQAAIEDQKSREEAIRSELNKFESAELDVRKLFSSIQQEVDSKRKTLKQIVLQIKTLRNELDSQQEAYRIELDELDQLHYVLQKELKLKNLIMNNFIPNNHVDEILTRIWYDEQRNCCTLNNIDDGDGQMRHPMPADRCSIELIKDFSNFWPPKSKSENHDEELKDKNNENDDDCSLLPMSRPRTEFERIGEALSPSNARFKLDNLIEPSLVQPPQMRLPSLLQAAQQEGRKNAQPNIHELLDAELNKHEQDLVI